MGIDIIKKIKLTSMCEYIVPLRELCAKLFCKGCEPSLSLSITSVDSVEILLNMINFSLLHIPRMNYDDDNDRHHHHISSHTHFIINVYTIKVELLHPSSHSVSGSNGISIR